MTKVDAHVKKQFNDDFRLYSEGCAFRRGVICSYDLLGCRLCGSPDPYQYQDLPLIKLFVYARIEGISGFQTLQKHLELRTDVVELVGLKAVPHRKTIAERFRSLPEVVSSVLTQLTDMFVETGDVDASIASVDSTLLHTQGNVWHKKQRDKGELPTCGNIDQEAHWGKSGCGEVVPALAGVLVNLTSGYSATAYTA